MAESNAQINGVHLVGSVPLENNKAVFDLSSLIMGQHLRRIPDGETGDRSNWIRWQFPVLAQIPQLEIIQLPSDRYGKALTQVKLRDDVSASDIEFGALGYSAAAIASYAEFSDQKDKGIIPPKCRFQVALPTPLAPIQFYVVPENREAIEPIYEAKLMEELREITAAIPDNELAIQWDTAVEFGILEGVFPTYLLNKESEILERLVRLGNIVPPEVELGYHLCYGDAGHKHFVEPQDTTHLVTIANGIASQINRPLNWIHLPIPRDRNDSGYYTPLKALKLHPSTEIYLGLVHSTDGVEGTSKRIETARGVVESFGVATECGFGRRAQETIPELMRIHTQVANPVR